MNEQSERISKIKFTKNDEFTLVQSGYCTQIPIMKRIRVQEFKMFDK